MTIEDNKSYMELVRRTHSPDYAREPQEKPQCSRSAHCEQCPYPSHGFVCWGDEDDCMRKRAEELAEKHKASTKKKTRRKVHGSK